MIKICPQCKSPGFDPWSGRSPEEGNGNPLQYSCLENPMDRQAWQANVLRVAKSQTWLMDWACMQPPPKSWRDLGHLPFIPLWYLSLSSPKGKYYADFWNNHSHMFLFFTRQNSTVVRTWILRTEGVHSLLGFSTHFLQILGRILYLSVLTLSVMWRLWQNEGRWGCLKD